MSYLLRKIWKIRFTLGPWFLASVIFVNVYQGIAVSSLLTPFQKTSISLFKHLTNIEYSYERIQKDNLWIAAYYYYKNNTIEFHEILKSKLKKNLIPRSINQQNEFNIFSSMTLPEDRFFNLNDVSAGKWGTLQKFFNWIYRFADSCVETTVLNDLYLDVGLEKDFETSRKKRYEDEILFNLFYPIHSHIPFELSPMAKNLESSSSGHKRQK